MVRAAADCLVHQDTLLYAVSLRPVSQSYVRRVVPLLGHRRLAMTVPDKPRSTAQRYVLTDRARACLAEQEERDLPGEPR